MTLTYIQKVKVKLSLQSGWDRHKSDYEKVFISESPQELGEKVHAFIKENTSSHYGDFGMCLGESSCEVGEVRVYQEIK